MALNLLTANEVVRASPRPRPGPAGGRTHARTPGDTASSAAGRVQDRWPHPTGWGADGRAGIPPPSRGRRTGQGSAPRARRGRTRNQPPRRHPSGHWHGPSPANGDRPQFSPSASPASRRLRPLRGFLQKQTSESAPSERASAGRGGEPRGRAEGRRGRAPTDSGRRRAPHSRSEEEPRRPARTPRPHSGEAAGGRAPASGAALALTRRREPPSPVGSPQSGHRAHPPFSSHLPKMAARGVGAIDHSVLGHSAGPI